MTASYTNAELSTPKSGKVRSVPMAPEVGETLARLGQRERYTGADDLVFVGLAGGHLDASALLRRYRAALRTASLRPLRFHDLRHTVRHYAPRHDDAAIVGRAFAADGVKLGRPVQRSAES